MQYAIARGDTLYILCVSGDVGESQGRNPTTPMLSATSQQMNTP
jgi:hypothetical protein